MSADGIIPGHYACRYQVKLEQCGYQRSDDLRRLIKVSIKSDMKMLREDTVLAGDARGLVGRCLRTPSSVVIISA